MSTLQNMWTEGDKAYFLHKSDNTEILDNIKRIKETTDRGMIRPTHADGFSGQLVGSIPALEYLRITAINPELHDTNRLMKWLNTDEGAGYRIASGQKARCANIIIK
jgi:hypothetical protein